MTMGGALSDLEQVLISKKETQESNILLSCKARLVRDFTAGALAGGTAAWADTTDSHWDQILTMDGSILQKELANIMVTKYQNDPSVMKLMSKHFYLERIFDDSSNNPKLRWRHRNLFNDKEVHGYRTNDHDSYDKSQDQSHTDSNDTSQGRSDNVTNSKKTNLETKHTFINGGPDMAWEADPLDCVFGYAPPAEDTIHSSCPNKPSGTQNRAHRRSRRRRRMRNHEDLSDLDA